MENDKIELYYNCVLNDPFTLEMTRGTRMYTGYKFVVYKKDKKEMMKFIEETIRSNGLPLDNIYFYKLEPNDETKVDTKEDIVRKVLEKKDNVLSQVEDSERSYGINLRDGKIVKAIYIYAFCVLRDPNESEKHCWVKYDGYSFEVKKEEKDEMLEFIKEAITSNGIPLIRMEFMHEELTNEHNLDTKESIVEKILRHKKYLLESYNENLYPKKKSRKK